jgi:capsid assembly protease
MSITSLLSGPWAITSEKYDALWGLCMQHKADPKALLQSWREQSAASALSEGKAPQAVESNLYTFRDGVALIPALGVISRRGNMFANASGGTSTELLDKAVRLAAVDPSVNSIVMQHDSPGGNALGIEGLARRIRAINSVKPVFSISDNEMLSASQWLGAAAGQSFLADSLSAAGSVGVVSRHVDVSEREREAGVKTTEIYAGKYKRVATQLKPLSDAGREYMQSTVDFMFTQFVNSMAAFRGVEPEAAAEQFANGKVFYGSQAVDAGLVDGIATLDEVLDRARFAGGQKSKSRVSLKGSAVNAKELREQFPSAVAEIEADAKAQSRDAIFNEGAQSEVARAAAVRAECLPGHENLIESLAQDGKTTGPMAAQAVLAAERSARVAAQQVIAAGKVAPIHASPLPAAAGSGKSLVIDAPAGFEMASSDAAVDAAVKNAMAKAPELTYGQALQAYLKSKQG